MSKCGTRLTLRGIIASELQARVKPGLSRDAERPTTLRPSDLHAMLLVVDFVKLLAKLSKLGADAQQASASLTVCFVFWASGAMEKLV